MIALTVLASGSQGNCAALEVGGGDATRLLLIDAGLSLRAARERLFTATGRRLEEASDLLLTHLDADHFRDGWGRFLTRHPLRVRLHPAHINEAIRLGVPELSIEPLDERCDLEGGLSLEPLRAPHDDRGTTAFLVEFAVDDGVVRLGYATDLGRVPEGWHERFRDLDILALESNYDPPMQLSSDRPRFLKERIMGGRGHLSNEQSLAAALRISRASELQAVVLLHLSRQCNCPRLVERLWRERAPHLAERLVVSGQFQPTPTIRAKTRPRRPGPVERSLFDALSSQL